MQKLLLLALSITLGNSMYAMNLPEVKNDMVTSGTYSQLAKRTKGPNRRAPNRPETATLVQVTKENEQAEGIISLAKNFASNNKKKLIAVAILALAGGAAYKLYGPKKDDSYKKIELP